MIMRVNISENDQVSFFLDNFLLLLLLLIMLSLNKNKITEINSAAFFLSSSIVKILSYSSLSSKS